MRGSRARLSEQALGALRALVDELDLVTRDELDELELRVAQLEHRLRLLEQAAPSYASSGEEPLGVVDDEAQSAASGSSASAARGSPRALAAAAR